MEIAPWVLMLFVVAAGGGAASYVLGMRDSIRRGRLYRRHEALLRSGALSAEPDARVPCPECAEAILPAARRCPWCRSSVPPRA